MLILLNFVPNSLLCYILIHVLSLATQTPKTWVGWVANQILLTSPEAKFIFPFLGPFGAWALDCDLASGLGKGSKKNLKKLGNFP